jgi:hypothetical protein
VCCQYWITGVDSSYPIPSTYGLKRTLAIESALLAMTEPVLNPVWVWMGYGEQPSVQALVGGCIIIAALAIRIVVIEVGNRRERAINIQ